MTPEQEQLLIQAVLRLEQDQAEFKQAMGQIVHRLEQGQAELRRDQAEHRGSMSQIVHRLEQGQEDLRQMVVETRGDMAQFTEWTERVTLAIEELRASRAWHEQLLRSLAAGQEQNQALIKQQQVMLDALLRWQRDQAGDNPDNPTES